MTAAARDALLKMCSVAGRRTRPFPSVLHIDRGALIHFRRASDQGDKTEREENSPSFVSAVSLTVSPRRRHHSLCRSDDRAYQTGSPSKNSIR